MGYNLKDIAGILAISYGTVRWHLVNLRRGFSVRTTRELLLQIEAVPTSVDTVPEKIKLSPRGKEVLELFMRSFTYSQIAEELGMSVSGVRRHCEKMLWKNGCESMLCLIAKYKQYIFYESCKHKFKV
jgi:DNA-binding CsgD family transcriptional regulator